MNIGSAAEICGLPPKTIRYYEQIELVRPARAQNGYREYGHSDVQRLCFLQRARGLGFSIEECRQLLCLHDDEARASADVKAVAIRKIKDIDTQISELKSLKRTLAMLVGDCLGDDKPECPIIDRLSGDPERNG